MTNPISDPLDSGRSDQPDTLLDAVNRLSGHVVALTDRLDVSVKQASRTRALSLAVAGLVVLMSVLSGLVFYRLHTDVQQNQTNAIAACENANDARRANLTLWTFLLDSAEKGSNSDSKATLEKIRTYVEVLYAAHDCSDLSRTYVIPDPPRLDPKG